MLSDLPSRRVDAWHRRRVRVTQGSTIRVGTNTYSVPSRLIGEQVDVHVMAECLEVWHGAVLVERVPRLRGRQQARDQLSPRDRLAGAQAGGVRGLSLPGRDVPDQPVSPGLRRLAGSTARPAPPRITCGSSTWRPRSPRPGSTPSWAGSWSGNVPITPTVVAEHLRHDLGLPRAMEVVVTTVDLSIYDPLLETREDFSLASQSDVHEIPDGLPSGAPPADDPAASTNRRRSGPVRSR